MTQITNEELSALKAKAEAATQGPWGVNMNTRHVTAPKSGNNKAICDWETNAPVAEANCLFIAAANPATVLSLISTITQLRARDAAAFHEGYKSCLDDFNEAHEEKPDSKLVLVPRERDAAFNEMLENVLTDHWLAGIECNHEAKTDKANCSCSLVNLPVMNSIGEAANTWVKHVVAEFQKARSAIAAGTSVIVPIEPDYVIIDAMRDARRNCSTSRIGGQTIEANYRTEMAVEFAMYAAMIKVSQEGK